MYSPGQLYLETETLDEARIVGQLRMDHLDGDWSPAGRSAEIDGPHATAAQPRAQSVRPDPVRIASPECAHAPTLPTRGVRDNPDWLVAKAGPFKISEADDVPNRWAADTAPQPA
jgi:hypothetical protein